MLAEWTISRELTRQTEDYRQKNKRGDRKEESNESPEILDRRDIRHRRPSFEGVKPVEILTVYTA